ncbi:hypothetical protein C0995_014429 [Termitomyces sp. Mi166|nr:hypothetical protein C0995_014429 [Termitomyces sp. Mi166\
MDEASATVVVLGGTPGILSTMPFFPHRDHQSVFPLPIKCGSYEEAAGQQAFTQHMFSEKLDFQAMQTHVIRSLFISSFHGTYYAVYWGKKPGIYTEWDREDNAECSHLLNF